MIWLLLPGIISLIIIYFAILKNWNYFQSQNVRFVRGWPILGCMADFVMGKAALSDQFLTHYWTYPTEKIIGIYEFIRPVYLIRDPELVKRISTTDFEYFINHATNVDESADVVLGKGLVFIKDERWRSIRTTLSSAFTGNKMRIMFQLMTDCSSGFVDHLKTAGNDQAYDMKKLFIKFAADIIATTSFGIKVNSLAEPNNAFFKNFTDLTTLNGWRTTKFLLFDSFPRILNFFKTTVLDKNASEHLQNIVKDTIKHREINKISRPDLIHLLMEARKDSKVWNDDYLVAQCLQFLFAGTETTSALMSFMAHELAVNPDIQRRLYDEILRTEESLNGSPITYDALNGMKYMDAVVSETLRRWPPNAVNDRLVNKAYTIKHDNKTINLYPGDVVWIPIYGFHMDEKYFADPHRFDPERFTEGNRDKLNKDAYMPFGVGPRLCLGLRFAVMECKAIFYHMLLEFSFERYDRTQQPLKLKRGTFNMTGEHGIWLQLRQRQ